MELCTALTAGGFEVNDVRTAWVLPDGSDARDGLGVIPTLQELGVFVGHEAEDGTSRAILGFATAWLRARRRRQPDDVDFVSVHGPDERRLIQVQIPRDREA